MTNQKMKINVKVIPSAKINQIQEGIDGSLRVHLIAKPVDGEANKKLVKVLEKHYNKKCTIVFGITSKNKIVEIED